MGVQIDQPRHHDQTGDIARLLTASQVRSELRHLAIDKRHIQPGIHALRRIDQPPTFQDQIEHAVSSLSPTLPHRGSMASTTHSKAGSMNDVAADQRTNSRIIAAYRERTPGSASLAKEAGELFPSGITHDARNVDPYCVFIQRAEGPHKWDVDGNRYIDYFGGH